MLTSINHLNVIEKLLEKGSNTNGHVPKITIMDSYWRKREEGKLGEQC
jgi:hypothetical protein